MTEGPCADAYDLLVIGTPEVSVAGLIITVRHGDLLMLDYLAVQPALRSQGIGHAALPFAAVVAAGHIFLRQYLYNTMQHQLSGRTAVKRHIIQPQTPGAAPDTDPIPALADHRFHAVAASRSDIKAETGDGFVSGKRLIHQADRFSATDQEIR